MTVRRKSSCIADVELSVSRINRLLRPLRNKCAILAAATSRPSASTAPITYGSTSSLSSEIRAPPPLDVLHDPKLVISRAHQESRSLDTLARQIYAVTNTYRNVVQAALSAGRVDGDRDRGAAVLALTDICAAQVGGNIRAEVAGCLAALEGERDEDDAKETALVDELYESVPARFRSWTLIAHATSEIVDTCGPGHPMLLLSLLGVTLCHGLYAESKTFLRLFLMTLIRPQRRRHHGNSNAPPPPIAHPMHPSYLVELCNEWTRMAPEHCNKALFSHRAFAAVTLEVLMDSEHGSDSAAAWTCKSVTRLVQLLRTCDFECFLTFLHGLVEILAARSQVWNDDDGGRGADRSLLARLAKWTGVITSDFFTSSRAGLANSGDHDGEGGGATHAHEFWAIVEILASAYDSGLHRVAIDDDGEEDTRDPQAALVCVATHCLSATSTSTRSSPLFTTISPQRRHVILSLLHDISPSSTTYDALADLPLARLRIIASALRTHGLNALERALWTCAVEHARSTLPVVDPELLAALEDVDECEQEEMVMVVGPVRRVAPAPTATSTSTRSPPRKRARREMTVQRRVSHRRLLSLSPSLSPSPPPSLASSSSSRTTGISAASTPSLSSSSSSRSFSGSPVPVTIAEECSEDEDEGVRFASTSCVDFRSILADALKGRTDLKEERRRASLRSARCCYASEPESGSGLERECSSCGEEEEEDTPACYLPSEGDALDIMFAYEDPS